MKARHPFRHRLTVSIKMTAFWDMAQCSIVEDRCFRDAYCLQQHGDGSTHLWNVGLLRDYTASYLITLSSADSPPWEPEISHWECLRTRYWKGCLDLVRKEWQRMKKISYLETLSPPDVIIVVKSRRMTSSTHWDEKCVHNFDRKGRDHMEGLS
jgi:hypothetical protein